MIVSKCLPMFRTDFFAADSRRDFFFERQECPAVLCTTSCTVLCTCQACMSAEFRLFCMNILSGEPDPGRLHCTVGTAGHRVVKRVVG